MDSTTLKQPWKAWYKAQAPNDANPLSKPQSLNGKKQGSLPQKARAVDLSTPKDYEKKE